MKRILLLFVCLIFIGQVYADSFGQRNATAATFTTVGSPFRTSDNCRSVTFIFRASYTGQVAGAAFTSTDVPLTITAQSQDTLRSIPFTVTAGTLIVVEQK